MPSLNPFDWPGPPFLAFYAAFGVLVVLVLVKARNAAEAGDPTRVDLTDPYLLAFLRGGANEAARVATISLVDRGLLKASETTLHAKAGHPEKSVRRLLEKRLLELFQDKDEATKAFSSANVRDACDELEKTLTGLGLLPTAVQSGARAFRLFLGVVALVGVAVTKIVLALSRGRHNVGFLIVLMFGFSIAAFAVSFPRQTARGRALLADARALFSSLKARASSLTRGGATADAVLLAAVFGVAALPDASFGFARKLYPKAAADSSSNVGSSCGSSCGSSSGSSSSCGGGGSSCGGGGCGGCGGGGD